MQPTCDLSLVPDCRMGLLSLAGGFSSSDDSFIKALKAKGGRLSTKITLLEGLKKEN